MRKEGRARIYTMCPPLYTMSLYTQCVRSPLRVCECVLREIVNRIVCCESVHNPKQPEIRRARCIGLGPAKHYYCIKVSFDVNGSHSSNTVHKNTPGEPGRTGQTHGIGTCESRCPRLHALCCTFALWSVWLWGGRRSSAASRRGERRAPTRARRLAQYCNDETKMGSSTRSV